MEDTDISSVGSVELKAQLTNQGSGLKMQLEHTSLMYSLYTF
jgi:hypothetical protein